MVYISERKKEEEDIIDKLGYYPFQKSEEEDIIDKLGYYPWRRNKEEVKELEEIMKKYNQKPEEGKTKTYIRLSKAKFKFDQFHNSNRVMYRKL